MTKEEFYIYFKDINFAQVQNDGITYQCSVTLVHGVEDPVEPVIYFRPCDAKSDEFWLLLEDIEDCAVINGTLCSGDAEILRYVLESSVPVMDELKLRARVKEVALEVADDYPGIEDLHSCGQLYAIESSYKGLEGANEELHRRLIHGPKEADVS